MQTQKQLISSINRQTRRLDRFNQHSQTKLTLRCESCGGLLNNHKEALSINDCGFCPDCIKAIALDHVQLEVQEYYVSEYGTELHND